MRSGSRVWRGGVALGGILISGCAHVPAPVAPELLGVWCTDKLGYEQNAMEFLDDAVIFTASDDHLTVHPITGFAAERQEQFERTRYDFQYSNEGAFLQAVLYLWDDGRLVFKNQRAVVWRLEPPSSASP